MALISIIIPALNEEKYLPKLLDSIKLQSFKDYEIIVADAGSKDKTVDIAKRYGCIVVKGGAPAVGRNAGANIAKGDFLFFFDSDVKLPSEFLKKAIKEMQEKYIDVATCEFRPLSNVKLDVVMHRLTNFAFRTLQHINPHAPGFCIFITKRLYLRIGGFDESLKLGEDHDFVKKSICIQEA
ncbi:MAG: glycosyltransferase [archaeon]